MNRLVGLSLGGGFVWLWVAIYAVGKTCPEPWATDQAGVSTSEAWSLSHASVQVWEVHAGGTTCWAWGVPPQGTLFLSFP